MAKLEIDIWILTLSFLLKMQILLANWLENQKIIQFCNSEFELINCSQIKFYQNDKFSFIN